MSHRQLSLAVALSLAAVLDAGTALAQAQPGAQAEPPVRVQRIDPSQLPPSFQRPGTQQMPHGGPAPGTQGATRIPNIPGLGRAPGGLQPGMRNPAPHPAVEEEAEAEGHGAEEHGHNEPPPPPNWWQGLLMVNNELAESPSFVNKLLFRYENPKNPHDPKNQPPPFLATVLNFGIFAFILYRFGRKPLAEALVKRKTGIMAEIDLATNLYEEAAARLEEYKGRFARMKETTAELQRDYAAQAEREKTAMLAEAEARRARMRRDAEFLVEQELKGAQAMLLKEAVEGAVSAAEELITAKVRPTDLDHLAEDYLGVVGATLRPGNAPRADASAAAQGAN
jgi:F-type H+-transporting ATPase subunit b